MEGSSSRERAPARPLPSPSALEHALSSPIPRRRALLVIAGGALATGGGLGAFLAACSPPPPVTVTVNADPASLAPGTPREITFPIPARDATVQGSAWLVVGPDGSLTAFNPNCTHARCAYAWSAEAGQFVCHCHDAAFALDGTVLKGPPPRPLDRFPATAADGSIQLVVPGDFQPPREG